MFTFFRKYQRFIYLVVTAVIILSFSFFGTYSAFTSGKGEDPVVFKTVAGKNITRSEFNDYVHFFSTDASNEGQPGNVLNDGVIESDIIDSPVGEVLATDFKALFQREWELRLKREKQFQPYKHPQAPFISAQQVWSYFAPEIKTCLEDFQSDTFADPLDLYKKKAALYLAEKRFPSFYLRQILHYQQKQFDWVEPDVSLDGRPLSLFGYQQITDWFGQAFVEKASEFIIQTAAKARMMGMSVSKGEVIASLYKNAQAAAKRLGESSQITPDELMKKTLLSLGMDESRAIKVWGDVLLFRKVLLDIPQRTILTPVAFEKKLQSEAETVEFQKFQLQPCFRLESLRDLFKVETWLDAVSKKKDSSSLVPSANYRSLDEIAASFPEFVERRFVLSVAEVDIAKVTSQLRKKDIWSWQNDHWDLLAKEIPSLKEKEVLDREGKFLALEKLSPQLKEKADEIAKKALVASRPEWLTELLEAAKPETKMHGIRLQGGSFPFEGIKDRKEFLKELAKASISEQSPSLERYSQDGKHFYRIVVLDRKANDEIVPLPDLLSDGTLDAVLDKILEASYERVRAEKPSEFKKENGTWKPFKEVKDVVAEQHFAPLLKRLTAAVKEWKDKVPTYCQWDDLKTARVAVRFLPLLAEVAQCLRTHGPGSCNVVEVFLPSDKNGITLESRNLSDLYGVVQGTEKVQRASLKENPAFADAFFAGEGAWLPVRYSQHLGPFVAQVKEFSCGSYKDTMRGMIYDLKTLIGDQFVRQKTEEYSKEFFGNGQEVFPGTP